MTTTPAAAVPSAAFLGVSIPGPLTLGAEGSPGKWFETYVSATDTVNLTYKIDVSAVKDIVEVATPDDVKCTTAGDTVTCALPDDPGEFVFLIGLRARPGASAGETGKLSVTVSADDTPASTAQVDVVLADGIDLVAPPDRIDGPEQPAKPGDTVEIPVSAANVGNRTAAGIVLTFHLDHGLVPAQYANCRYLVGRLATRVTCELPDVSLDPGFEQVFEPFQASVAADGFGIATLSYLAEGLAEATPLPAALQAKATAGTGGKKFGTAGAARRTAAQRAGADIDLSDNFGGGTFDITNTVDLSAVGATAGGAANATVSVPIGVRNNGKGALISFRSGGEPVSMFEFIVPPGTEVVGVPADCAGEKSDGQYEDGLTGAAKYQCRSSDAILVSETYTAEFRLKITTVTADSKGTVSLLFNERPGNVTNNDTADVVINPTTAPGSGGGLPITGTNIGLAVAGGAVLVAGGVLLMLMARRRRIVTVADENA